MDESFTASTIQAQTYFNNSDFSNAADILNKIVNLMNDLSDVRLNQNIAVTTFMIEGQKSVDNLLNSLLQIACSKYNKPDATIDLSSSLDLNWVLMENVKDMTNSQTSTVMFNLASIYFHKHQYERSHMILETLFVNLENIKEELSLKICFLFLEVVVRLYQIKCTLISEPARDLFVSLTSSILKNAEKYSSFSTEERKASTESDATVASLSILSNVQKTLATFRVHLYRCRIHLQLNQVKSAKKEIKNAMEVYQRELRPYVDVSGVENGGGHGLAEGAISSAQNINLEITLPLAMGAGGPWHTLEHQNQIALHLKANMEYLKRNYPKSLRLLSSCHRKDGPSLGGASVTTAAVPQPSLLEGPIYFNNVACVYVRMQRYNAAKLYFQKALGDSVCSPSTFTASSLPPKSGMASEPNEVAPGEAALPAEAGQPHRDDNRRSKNGLLVHSYTKDILYNTGVSLLLTGKPLEAFQCFEGTSHWLRDRPQLWVRMAECCIQYDVRKRDLSQRRRSRLYAGVEGQARSRRIVLRPSLGIYDYEDSVDAGDERDEGEGSSERDREILESSGITFPIGVPIPPDKGTMTPKSLDERCSLIRAAAYLRNALTLVKNGNGASRSTGTAPNKKPDGQNPPPDSRGKSADNSDGSAAVVVSGDLGNGENDVMVGDISPQVLEDNILIQLAYVHLNLKDAVSSLYYARIAIQRLGHLGEKLRFLVLNYFLESLCALERYGEAVAFLEKVPLTTEFDMDGSTVPCSWSVDGVSLSPSSALSTAIFLVNRGTALAFVGRLDEAKSLFEAALKSSAGFAPAIHGLLYICLKKGQHVEALHLLRTLRP